jgi:uncharacterized protein
MSNLLNRFLAALAVFSTLSLAPATLTHARTEAVEFPGGVSAGGYFPTVATVKGTLTLPRQAQQGPVPAVVLLHGSGGIDGRGAYHAAGLNDAGYATLEVFMFDRGARPREGHTATLTHAYGALKFLATHPAIRPEGIGVMGFSWGANMALRMASAGVRNAFTEWLGGHNFGAHVGFYPVCYFFQNLAGQGGTFAEFTGAPVWLAIGDKDDYGEPNDCPDFAATVADASKGKLTVTVYPGATHGWDVPGGASRTVPDPSAHRGKGGQVRMFSDHRIAARSRTEAIQFFDAHLKTKP